MLITNYENKDAGLELELAAEAESFEANCHLIAVTFLERFLKLTYRDPGALSWNYQKGNPAWLGHLEAFKNRLRAAISTELAQKQADEILAKSVPGSTPWEALPGVPLPQPLPEYSQMFEARADDSQRGSPLTNKDGSPMRYTATVRRSTD